MEEYLSAYLVCTEALLKMLKYSEFQLYPHTEISQTKVIFEGWFWSCHDFETVSPFFVVTFGAN